MTKDDVHSWPWLRILAIVALFLAAPILLLKLPWLPSTALIFVETISESTAGGSPGYVEAHKEKIQRLAVALALYAVGLWAVFGLVGVVTGICRRPVTQAISWLSALLVGIALPFFDAHRIGPETDSAFVFVVVYLPVCMAILSAAALLLLLLHPPRS